MLFKSFPLCFSVHIHIRTRTKVERRTRKMRYVVKMQMAECELKHFRADRNDPIKCIIYSHAVHHLTSIVT